MRCNQCGLENIKQSKFCRKCGSSLGVRVRCVRCGHGNFGDSIFCTECGERLPEVQKSMKGNHRKCRKCGHFNELDASFCVACGEEIVKITRNEFKEKSVGPSYKTIALVIGMVFLFGFVIKLGINFSKEKSPSKTPASSLLSTASLVRVDESKMIAVAKNFKCACGGCGELPLATCECDMRNGAVEEKNFIREKLAEGFSVEQAIELLDKKYGHRA